MQNLEDSTERTGAGRGTVRDRESLDRLVADAPGLAAMVTEAFVREEFETWLARHFGVGCVGRITANVIPGPGGSYGTTDLTCFADVDGLPLHPHQVLSLERRPADLSCSPHVVAYLYTSTDGRPHAESSRSEGVLVRCLAELDGKLL